MNLLKEALNNPIWINHKKGKVYFMDGKSDKWEIVYYPIFENGKTGEKYEEPRALIERPIDGGIDFREIPLRYLTITPKKSFESFSEKETQKNYNKAINHIKRSGLLTDPLYMTQVRNAIHIAAFGEKEEKS